MVLEEIQMRVEGQTDSVAEQQTEHRVGAPGQQFPKASKRFCSVLW